MKVVLIGVVALLVGVGGGAFLSGTKVKDQLLEVAAAEAAALEAAGADSLANGSEAGSGGDPGGHTTESDPAHSGGEGDDPAGSQSGDATPVEDEPIQDAPPEVVEDPGPTADDLEEGARKLAKIFGAMQADDAADVLQQMSDPEVERILMHMSDRLAAQILGAFEPSRAAALSRGVLGGSGDGQ